MFSSSSLEKSSLGPENSPPGRNNLPNRFPVGIPSLPDENQQIRIQLAVHKYNNSANGPLNNGRSSVSPVVHSFLKNSLKVKNHERSAETSLKNDNKSGNQYEGVGAFPTIHLKKSSVRYRPIRRFNQVKVPYPELPVNRFLSHLPELCPDLKSSTRSVLDVLQDLSGKKIHGRDDEGCNKPRSKGLGGDFYLDPNAAYKPLFVQKPKASSVTTKDNTTQTLLPHSTDPPSPQCGNSAVKNDSSDPRAELRRRLARQNNEIFASLSSSIPASYTVKRKIDKVLPAKDGDSTDGSAAKKSKTFDNHTNHEENGVSKVVKNGKMTSSESGKFTRKSKLAEASATSPNKDRLTTIFLDMQNTSPKAQVFQNNSPSPEAKDSTEEKAPTPTSTSNDLINNKIGSPHINGAAETTSSSPSSTNSTETSATNSSSSLKPPANGEKQEAQAQPSKPTFSFPVSNAVSSATATNATQSNVPTFQFGANTNASSNFTFPKASAGNCLLTGGFPADSSTTASGKTYVTPEKKDDSKKTAVKPFTFGSSNDTESKKPNFSSFKFGTDGNSSAAPGADVNKSPTTAPAPVTCVTTSSTTSTAIPQFSFGAKSTEATTTTGGIQFGQTIACSVSSSQTTFTTLVKPSLTVGQPLTASQISNKGEEKTETSKSDPPTSATTTQSIFGQGVQSPGMFSFGSKPAADPAKTEVKSVTDGGQSLGANTSTGTGVFPQIPPTTTTASTTQSAIPAIVSQTNSFLQNSSTAGGLKMGTNPLFTFGQKLGGSATPADSSEAPKPQSTFAFTFGQKTESSQSKPPESVFDQKSPANLFTFGQKPPEPPATSAASSQPDSGQTTSQNLLKPQTSTSSTVFGTNVSQASSTPQIPTFGQTPTSGAATAFGAKSESVSFGQMSVPAFGQSNSGFASKTPLFGTSTAPEPASRFATTTTTTTTQATTGFGTSTSGIGFGAPTTQSTPAFGAPAVSSQSIGGFGGSSSTQPGSGFGTPASTSSSIGFGGAAGQSGSGFGTPAFGTAPSSQSGHGFGVPAATQSTAGFGLASSSSSFAQTFNTKPVTSLGQTPSIFESSTMNQNPANNSGFGSALNGGQNSVFGQKTAAEGGMFGQANKVQSPSFGQGSSSQSFGSPNKFPPFGMSTSAATGFTSSAPGTTTSGVFNFGGGSSGQSSTFTFGGTSSGSSTSSQTPFTFKAATNDAFKFGASTAKEGNGFGGGNPRTFNFGGQMNETMGEAKPQEGVFSFGNAQASSSSSSSGFNFGTTSPAVFSFGGSGSSGSSGSSFNFGTPQPGGPFGQSATPSPGAPFAVPGMFRIGSGSSQSRPRASSRPRRRP